MHPYYQTVMPEVNTFRCFTCRYFVDDNTRMDIVSIRRQRLRSLIVAEYGGSQASFVEKTGINQGELSGLLKKKSFGEKRARSLEMAADLPVMYFDRLEPDQSGGGVVKPTIISSSTPALTAEQQKILAVVEGLAPEARDALLKAVALLSKRPRERRHKKITPSPAERMGDIVHGDTLLRSEFEALGESKEDLKKRGGE